MSLPLTGHPINLPLKFTVTTLKENNLREMKRIPQKGKGKLAKRRRCQRVVAEILSPTPRLNEMIKPQKNRNKMGHLSGSVG